MVKNNIYKRIVSLISVLSLVMTLFAVTGFESNVAVASDSYVKTFTVSAYYSPLLGQDFYTMGSYEADIRMNGRGTNGADGTEVYVGMIAAPKSYAFGTVMNIPNIGTVAVHDRGGAIVEHDGKNGVYDRLDIWMGHGDEGLTRALNWGKRNVDVTVYAEKPADYVKPASAVRPSAAVVAPPVVKPVVTPEALYGVSSDVISMVNLYDDYGTTLTRGSVGDDVTELQSELTMLNFYRADLTGVYDDLTIHAVYKFQQSQGVIKNDGDVGAGVFGPKTRNVMNSIISKRNESNVRVAAATVDYKIANPEDILIASASEVSVVDDIVTVVAIVESDLLLHAELNFGMTGGNVRVLQEFLAFNGYIDASRATAYYGDETKAAVLRFQLDNGIISSELDNGAGRVGPATMRLINVLS